MSLPKEWPHEVTNGNTTIPIYFTKTTRGYNEFKVVWKVEGNRRFKTFADFDDAKKFANNLNTAINAGDIKATVLKDKDRHAYLDALEALGGISTPLNIVVREYADAVKRLGAVTVKDAVNFYLKHNAGVESRTVQQVFSEFVVSKRKPTNKGKKPASEKHLDDIESRLGKFADAFQCKISDVRPTDIQQFLSGLGEISGRTWFNYARLIRSLFNYAQAKRYIPSNIDPMEGIEIEYDDDGEIEIFTPEELKKLFASARPELIPFLAIAAFAGVRHGEIARMDWRDISQTHITVEAGRAKTRSRRVIQLQPALANWLAPYRQKVGPVAPFANMSKQLLWLADDAKVKWKHNALRHSFISYRLAKTNDENLTAVEAGNSPTMIQHHYRQIKDHTGRVVTSELADAWFSISPETSEKIVPMVASN